MAKRETEFKPGGYYHLYNRGANRQSIFHADEDYLAFLTRLKKHVGDCHIAVIAYCLMPNHFHLLVRQESERKAGLAVQFTCKGYTQWFNVRHQHEGTLFQGRYHSLQIDNDEYLRHLCRSSTPTRSKTALPFNRSCGPTPTTSTGLDAGAARL